MFLRPKVVCTLISMTKKKYNVKIYTITIQPFPEVCSSRSEKNHKDNPGRLFDFFSDRELQTCIYIQPFPELISRMKGTLGMISSCRLYKIKLVDLDSIDNKSTTCNSTLLHRTFSQLTQMLTARGFQN